MFPLFLIGVPVGIAAMIFQPEKQWPRWVALGSCAMVFGYVFVW